MHAQQTLFAALLLTVSGCWMIPQGVSVQRTAVGLTVEVPGSEVTVGSGELTEEELPVDAFSAVRGWHGFDLRLDPELAPGRVVVQADDNLHGVVEAVVEEGLLQVRAIGSLKTKTPILVRVPMEGVNDLKACTQAVLTVDGDLAGPDLALIASTGGRVKVGALDGDRVRLDATTSGRVEVGSVTGGPVSLSASTSGRVHADSLSGGVVSVGVSTSSEVKVTTGQADEMKVSASTSGKYVADGVTTGLASVSASTSGEVHVRATEVTGSASTSGKVHCYGEATKVEVNTSTSGKVIRVE